MAGPLGMVASVGLSAVGKLLKKKKESSLDEAYSFEGVLERAMLREAALEAVVQLGPAKCKDLGIFKRMQPTVRRLRPIRWASPSLMPFMMEPAWRLTSAALLRKKIALPPPKKEHMKADVESASVTAKKPVTFGPLLDPKTEAFLEAFTEGITAAAAEESNEGVEGTEFDVGATIDKAIRIAGPNLGGGVETGLARLAVGDAGGPRRTSIVTPKPRSTTRHRPSLLMTR